MILQLMVLAGSLIAGLVIPYFSLDECKGKERILRTVSMIFLLITASAMMLSINNLPTMVLGAASGIILMFALRAKVKKDLTIIILGLGLGLINSLLITYLSILYLIPSVSLISMPLLVKKKRIKPLFKASLNPLIMITVSVIIGLYIPYQKQFISSLISGSLLLISVCGIKGLVK